MNITDYLKNVDFKKQTITITFNNGEILSTPYLVSENSEYFANLPIMTFNEDETVTLEYNDKINCFKISSIQRVTIQPFHLSKD